MKFKVIKRFRQAIDIRNQLDHKVGDKIEVPDDKVEEWAAAGWIPKLKAKIGDIGPIDTDDDDEDDTDAEDDDGTSGDGSTEGAGDPEDETDGSDDDTDVSDSSDASGEDAPDADNDAGSDDSDVEEAADYMTMDKTTLIAFAKSEFDADLKKRATLESLQAQVSELMKAV